MDIVKENIVRTYQQYIKAFQSLKAAEVVPFCHLPFMTVSSRAVGVITTAADINDNFNRHMEILKKYNYEKTEISDIHIKLLSDGLALMSVALERFSKDGKKIGGDDVVYTYTFRKVDDVWKIVVTMAHDSLLRLD